MTLAILLVACLVLAAAVGALATALSRLHHRLADELAALRADMGALADGGLVKGASAPSSTNGSVPSSTNGTEEYVITRLGSDEPDDQPVDTPDARLFADLLLRETVVKAASLAYGVRRGLSPANRNRIWFEMRREVKRARRERKAEERVAIREWRARQRAAQRHGQREDDAA
jgi:hypothetical protein